eukprot:GILJ01013433.1.p1 GENE.GILJ01013433.1~~GILJ01013433.1.p1  ORF type:complete len:549 (+),score=74.51 GILJ01013433.1:138-1784(+)
MLSSVLLRSPHHGLQEGLPVLDASTAAVCSVADCVRATFGPRGRDKVIKHPSQTDSEEESGQNITITNDGATVVSALSFAHPVARMIADISKAQDEEVGDGTTTVVLLTAALLSQANSLLHDRVHPLVVLAGMRAALKWCLAEIDRMQRTIDVSDVALLRNVVSTVLQSKTVRPYRMYIADLLIQAVTSLSDPTSVQLEDLNLVIVPGASVMDSYLLESGILFAKTFSYAGYALQPQRIQEPTILLLDLELELKHLGESANLKVSSSQMYAEFVDVEYESLYDKLDLIQQSQVNIVLSSQIIGDAATQFFAKKRIFAAGRIPGPMLAKISRATGATIIASVTSLKRNSSCLGRCSLYEETVIGNERFHSLRGCVDSPINSLVLRGGTTFLLQEVHRSIHDALCILTRILKHKTVLPGGGAVEFKLAHGLRKEARDFTDVNQLIFESYAKALETLPCTLADNAGLDSGQLLSQARYHHRRAPAEPEVELVGIDVFRGGLVDSWKDGVWVPSLVTRHALRCSTEAACFVLSVDGTAPVIVELNKSAGTGP